MNLNIRFSLLSLFVVTALFSCRQVTAPEYIDVKDVELKSKGLTRTTLSARVRMYNPNKSNLVFKSGSLNIFVDDRLLGHTELDSTISIPKLDTFHIPVNVQIDLKNIIGNAMSLAFKDSVLLRVEGNIRVGKSGIFVTRPVRYEQKEKLDLF